MSESVWEKSKENIQPLSGGRKMTSLNHSLQNDSANDLDIETQLSIEKLANNITAYAGDDPIEPWVQYISFLQQHRLNDHGKYNSKFKEVILKCVKKFMVDTRYKNDKRFIEVYLKSVIGVATTRQIALIKTVLSKGIGATVAKMYTTLAELYEVNSQNSLALDMIREGLNGNAEPRDVLEEYEKNLEFRMAMQLASSMKKDTPETGDVRLFGSSVPLDYNMEASCVRVELPPASSSHAIPLSRKLEKVPIFTDENENGNPHRSSSAGQVTSFDPVRELQQIEEESENLINPTKWNTAGVEMSEPVIPQFEKVEIYVSDEEDSVRVPESSQVVRKGVLAERKVEDMAEFVEVKISVAPPDAQGSAPGVRSNIPAGLTFIIPNLPAPRAAMPVPQTETVELSEPAPGRSTSDSAGVFSTNSSGLSSSAPGYEPGSRLQWLYESKLPPVSVPPAAAQKDAKTKTKVQKPALVVKNDVAGVCEGVSMYRKEQLLRNGREISFEQLRAEAFFKSIAAMQASDTHVPVGNTPPEPVSCDATARELKAVREDYEIYKETSTNAVAELRKTLEAACTAFSNVMTKAHVLENELAALKLKIQDCACHANGTGSTNQGGTVQAQIHEIVQDVAEVTDPPSRTHAAERDDPTDIENRTVDVYCKRQLLKYTNMCQQHITQQPFTTIETYEDAEGNLSNISIDIVPGPEVTEAVFSQKVDNFNVTNLTHALNFRPRPMHSSSPDKKGSTGYDQDDEEDDEFGDLGSLPLPTGPFTTPYTKRNTFNQTLQEVAQNLSTIAETSKERSSTTGSSSSNLTGCSSTRNSTILMRSASKSGNPVRYQHSQTEN